MAIGQAKINETDSRGWYWCHGQADLVREPLVFSFLGITQSTFLSVHTYRIVTKLRLRYCSLVHKMILT